MTTTELKKKIAEAANQEWFRNIQITFNFSGIGQNYSFQGLSAIYEYINQQLSGWENLGNLPNELIQSKTYFANIKNSIIQFVNNYVQQSNANNLSNWWQNNVVNQAINRIPQGLLPYNVPQVDFLLKIYNENGTYYQGAYNFIAGTNNYNINSRELLYGAILAYEFSLKDRTEITERRKAEQSSISKLRNDFQKYLSESENQLSEHLNNANTNYTEYAKKIDDLKTEKENLFSTWFEETKNEKWEKWFAPTIKKIAELENTYQEKLKLEEPAKYWSDRAKTLKKQGWISLGIGVGLVVIICLFLGWILLKTPDIIYASWFGEDKSTAIKWTMIYITLISFLAYSIRALLKVMFSSFHLARDCEERHTLTYFYLSLLKDSKVDEKDRQLIMQSLFSRAETGLLKEDSSPTMPNDLINKFIATK